MDTLTESEAKERYDKHLDEFNIDQFIQWPTSELLREVDPIMYDCGFVDFCDAENIEIS